MPRERRKRGRAGREEALSRVEPDPAVKKPKLRLPSPVTADASALGEPSPWPKLDPDTRAYFKSIQDRILELEALGVGVAGEEAEDEDGDERTQLIRGSLQQLSGHEIELATDAESAIVLERLTYSMDDFARRVLADRFAGQYAALSKHPFASHVIQTLFTLSARTIDRERRGIIASPPAGTPSDAGVLPHMTDLLVAACSELGADASALLYDPCGSHVLRAALRLCYGLPVDSSDNRSSGGDRFRSKKSKQYMAHQAPLRSLLPEEDDDVPAIEKGKGGKPPKALRTAGKALVSSVNSALVDSSALKRAGAHHIATITIQLLLEIESSKGKTSLLTRLIDAPDVSNAFIETILRDQIASRLFEAMIAVSPDDMFRSLWSTYISGDRLCKLAAHPVANFVVAKAVRRLDAAGLDDVAATLKREGTARKMAVDARTGVLRAAIERAAELQSDPSPILAVIKSAFGIVDGEHATSGTAHLLLVLCVLSLRPLDIFRSSPAVAELRTMPASTLQGAVLLQSWLRLPSPHSTAIVEGLRHLPSPLLIEFASDKVSSHVIDAAMTSSTVEPRERRRLIQCLIPSLHVLAGDRIGSRVCDSCWAAADTFLKGKMAASLLPHEVDLHGSEYGRFFARKLQLPVYKSSPGVWAKKIAKLNAVPVLATATIAKPKLGKAAVVPGGEPADEIDAAFAEVE